MSRKSLIWQLFPSYLLVIVISLIATILFVSGALRDFYVDQTFSDLHARAVLFQRQTEELIHENRLDEIDKLCKQLGPESGTRITVISPEGVVLGDSDEDPAVMDNHSGRPEIVEAYQGRTGVSTRYSKTVKREMMYVAIPLSGGNDKLLAVVRTSIPLKSVDRLLGGFYNKMLIGALTIAALVALISLLVSRQISRPLVEIKSSAEHFAGGDLSYRLPATGSAEMSSLAEAMNKMAAQLDERIKSEIRQRNEQEAVLSSMVEGVIAVDTDEHLININQAAARMLDIPTDKVRGSAIKKIIKHSQLQSFVSEALAGQKPIEKQITFGDDDEEVRYLQAHGTLLVDGQGGKIGALIVLNDITRLHKLENVRRDFVANVSHELRTPITSIKGFIETLQDGALNKPDDARRFLSIVARQADHLNNIVEDLLTLSRIEQDAEKSGIVFKETNLKEVLDSALQVCEVKASGKGIVIDVECPEDILIRANPPLLEQAIVNLAENAVKFSNPDSRISVRAARMNAKTVISVQDYGAGIEKRHLARLFERFYRVDQGRDKKSGGTGLGLAIVKHIAMLHNGEVNVTSTLGVGSIFSILLPSGRNE